MLPEVIGAHSNWGFHMGTLCDGGGPWIGIGCGRSRLVWGTSDDSERCAGHVQAM